MIDNMKPEPFSDHMGPTWSLGWSPECHLREVGKARRGPEWLQLREQLL